MIKILIVCKGHPDMAGAQMYLKHIALLFPKKNFELCFALRRADGLKFIEEISEICDTVVAEYDWRHLSFLSSLMQGWRLFRQKKPELIIFNSPEDQILAPIWAAYLSGVPHKALVVHWAQSEHDMPLFSKKRRLKIPIPSPWAIRTRLTRAIGYRLLDALIFVSHGTHRAYTKLYKVPDAKCHTIHNGVDVERFYQPQLRNSTRRHLGISPDEGMLLATGNLSEVKGHAFLVAAMHTLLSKGLRLKCFIAGRGELEAALKRKISDLGLENYVFLIGYRTDIPALLSAADIFCMPSLNEAFGYSLVEAMAAGLPIVASSVGGIPEVVSDAQEGLLVAAGDVEGLSTAIATLWQQPALREKMGSAGLAKSKEKFDRSIMLRQTEKLFSLLLQNSDE